MKYKDNNKNKTFYRLSCLIYEFFDGKIGLSIKADKVERLRKVNVGMESEEIEREYYSKFIMIIMLILLCALLVIPVYILSSDTKKVIQDKYFIEKGDVGSDDKSEDIITKIDESKKDITLDIPAKVYSEEELKKKAEEAEKFIRKNYLGSNKSSDNITKDFNFMSKIPGNAIEVKWHGDSEGYISDNGKLQSEKIEYPKQVEISATLKHNDFKKNLVFQVTIVPKKKNRSEVIWDKWKEIQEMLADRTAKQEYLQLPTEVMGHKVYYSENEDRSYIYIILGVILCIVSVPFLMESRLKSSIEKRNVQLKKSYPELIEKFILLISAGMGIKGAWFRITDEYVNKGDKENIKLYAYEEMLVTRHHIENGMAELKAYELFGRRIGLLPYMKFSTLITQNLRKGTSDMLKILEYEAVDVMNEKKENAKILGEEASTKLLLPMMIMMVEVFAIILYAAFQNM